MSERGVLMKCGCVAQGTCSAKGGVKFDPPVPACITHDCLDVEASQPDLTGRMARCDYFGRGGFRNHGPIYGGGSCDRRACRCLVPSDLKLPFFVFRGVDSPIAKETCKCGKGYRLHWPRWRATIKVVRRWFKIERSESTETPEEHMPDGVMAAKWAEAERERWLKMADGPSLTGDRTEPTKVFSAELIDLKEVPNRAGACGNFVAAGPMEYDSFFCGCAGWD